MEKLITKEFIKAVQKILMENYNYYVFGKGNQDASDEETEFYINAFLDLQNDMDELYKKWGYEYIGDYEAEPKEIREDQSKKTAEEILKFEEEFFEYD